MPKIFISYSHDSPEHADRVLALANRLINDGLDCVLDQYEESPAEGWTRWMDRQIRSADFVLMVFTETYCKRVNGQEEVGKGLGVKWEGKLIYQHLYQADANSRFIPVVFTAEHTQFISTPLQDATYYLLLNDEDYEKLYRRLTHQPKNKKPEPGKLRELPPRERKQDFFITPRLFTAKLPSTTSTLFGREDALKKLDAAWANAHTHVLALVAWGGVGKTALVNAWLNQLEADNYRGAERVYAWSFYSQGTSEDRNVSSDAFFDQALRWFGDTSPVLSPWDKGVRLAELVRQQKTLLLLDGVEPLQYPPGPLQGELKDQGLKALLKELARANPGLCVVTTRVTLKDLTHTEGKTTQAIPLENLRAEAGCHLLRHLEVRGEDKELRQAAQEFGGHALALTLLGRYLAVVHAGDIRKRDLIPHLTEEEDRGGHARRVMESYERWLHGTPECNLLYVMGLFDRPATAGALQALRAAPAIAGLTHALQTLSEAKWHYAVQHLRELRLLADGFDSAHRDTLDCHPLVREHFGEKLRQQNPAAWKEAHGRLYEYYKKLPTKELPDTLEEMEPLFAAVAHGCQAGQHQEALLDVYWKRIKRGDQHYCTAKLGAFGADLSALSNFFEVLWRQPASGLRDDYKAVVLSWAGFRLRALGRLAEASQPMQAGMEASAQKEDWKGAAQDAGNLSELYLTLGEVSQAVAAARQSVDFADRSGDGFQKEAMRTTLADALHQAGELTEAQKFFREAEAMQQQRQPEYAYLYSLQGFQFCDLLLSQGQYQEVQKRARQTLEWVTQQNWLLDIALDKLSLGRAFLLEALTPPFIPPEGGNSGNVAPPGKTATQPTREQPSNSPLEGGQGGVAPHAPTPRLFDQARDQALSQAEERALSAAEGYLQQAVAGLREASRQDYLPRALFARTVYYRSQNNFAHAEADLTEAHDIAERGGMKLFLAEYHLEACRLCLAEHVAAQHAAPVPQKAQAHLAEAKRLIEQTGYARRAPEAEELEKQLQELNA